MNALAIAAILIAAISVVGFLMTLRRIRTQRKQDARLADLQRKADKLKRDAKELTDR